MNNISLKITNPEKHIQAQNINANNNLSDKQKRKLEKASRDFESLMTSMLLKSMTKTTEGGLFGEGGYGGDVLDTIFEGELSSYMTRSQSMGIADMIYQKLTGEKLPNANLSMKPLSRPGKIEIKKNDSEVPSIAPSGNAMKRLGKYDSVIKDAAAEFGVSENLIRSIILTESAAKEKAVSKVKAKGLMQLMDGTAREMGVANSFDPKSNIFGGTKYIAAMLRKFDGDVEKSLAAYNAGPRNVEKYDGIPPFKETQNYVTRVLGYLNHFEEY
ncbi:MAG: transglycosylase SLT domain-containing protein [Chlorobi bacterium]|nr:transglycosylase SLT domain-containing protein [Chlorobiota bacterium]